MYEGNPVDLKMEKVFSIDEVFDEEVHHCRVFKYDIEEDFIKLVLENEELPVLSLDAKYECTLSTKKELLSCMGTVRERYCSENGNMLVFLIEDGFYSSNPDKSKQ